MWNKVKNIKEINPYVLDLIILKIKWSIKNVDSKMVLTSNKIKIITKFLAVKNEASINKIKYNSFHCNGLMTEHVSARTAEDSAGGMIR